MSSQRGKNHGWFTDPLRTEIGKGTVDCPGHKRQCQSKNKYGEQCGRWALKGRHYCQFHGGRQPLTRFKVSKRYGKYVTKKLGALIQEMSGTPQEVLDLTEELNISRLCLGNALKLATPCFDPDYSDKIDADTKALAISTLRGSLDFVAKMVSNIAKIESLSTDKVPTSHLGYLMTEVLEIIERECPDKLAEKIGRHIAEIKLPDETTTRVTLELD